MPLRVSIFVPLRCPPYPSVLLPFIPVPYVLLTPRSSHRSYLFLLSCLPLCPAPVHTCSSCPAYSAVLLPFMFLMSRLPLGPPIHVPYVPLTPRSCYCPYLFFMSRLLLRPLCPAYPDVLLPLIPVPYVPLAPASCYHPYVLYVPLTPVSCYHLHLFLMSRLPLCPATIHICSLCPAYLGVLLPPIPVPYVPLNSPQCRSGGQDNVPLGIVSCYPQ
jgi:hypothetical protein